MALLPPAVSERRSQGAQVPELPSLMARDAGRYRSALAAMDASAACRAFIDVGALRTAFETIANGNLDYYGALAVDRTFGVALFVVDLERGGR